MADDSHKDEPGEDFLSLGPEIGGGWTTYLRHRPDHSLELGVGQVESDITKIPDGSLALKRTRQENVYEVAEVHVPKNSGPAQVSSPAFRAGWDRIFGIKQPVGQA